MGQQAQNGGRRAGGAFGKSGMANRRGTGAISEGGAGGGGGGGADAKSRLADVNRSARPARKRGAARALVPVKKRNAEAQRSRGRRR